MKLNALNVKFTYNSTRSTLKIISKSFEKLENYINEIVFNTLTPLKII